MNGPLRATLGLTVVDDTGTMHARCWRIPAEMATQIGVVMTVTFGAPDEMITTAEAMQAGGEQAAADGTAVYLPGHSHG